MGEKGFWHILTHFCTPKTHVWPPFGPISAHWQNPILNPLQVEINSSSKEGPGRQNAALTRTFSKRDPCASQEGASMLLRREGRFSRREGGFLRRGGGFLRRGGGFLRRSVPLVWGARRWAAFFRRGRWLLKKGGRFLRTLCQCGGFEGVRPPPGDPLCVSLIFQKVRAELLPSSVWHESGTHRKMFRKTCSDGHFYFGWIGWGEFLLL